MNRLFSRIALLTALLLLFAACSSTKPPAPAAVQGSKVITTLKDLSTMYGKKNLPGFMNLIAPDYKDRSGFSSALESVFSKYDTVQFTIQYTRMFISIEDKGMTKATFNWESGWGAKGGSLLKNSGRATFLFEPKDAALLEIDGKNPFIPQPVEAPKP